jgi:hypothetical protein
MKKINFLLTLPIIALIVTLTSAWRPPVKSCHTINAKGTGTITSPPGPMVTTEANINGGGLLNGTTSATFTFSDPSTGAFGGTLVFTTKHGTLEFDIDNGQLIEGGAQFSATAVAVEGSGTGKLEGATGELQLEGVSINSSGDFTEDVSGYICFE